MENGWEVMYPAGSQNEVDALLISKKPFAEMEVTGELSIVNKNKKIATIPVTEETVVHKTVREKKSEEKIKNKTKDQITTKLSFVSVKVPYKPNGQIQRGARIDDPMFRLPYELGWKRYILKRTEQTYKLSDVFYIAPNHEKRLRSKRDVKKMLDSLKDNNSLTIDNFTFRNERIIVHEVVSFAHSKKSKKQESENFEPAT